jgi:PKD repeat protein
MKIRLSYITVTIFFLLLSLRGVGQCTLPAAAGSINATNPVCQGDLNKSYSVPAIANATSYIWTYPSGASIVSGEFTNNISVNFSNSATSGIFTVKGRNACGDGPSSITTVTVNPIPAVAGSITGSTSVCQGANGVTYSINTIANATGYSWSVPLGGTIVSQTTTPVPTITVNFSNTATPGDVSVHGTNDCGNGVSSNLSFTVKQLPDAAGFITGTTPVCQNQTGVNYSVAAIANATGYNWTLPPGANITAGTNTNRITVSFSNTSTSGNISVAGTNSCGSGIVSPSYAFVVNNATGAAGIIIGNSLVCQGLSGVTYFVPSIANATVYEWNLPPNSIITAGNNTNSISVSFLSNATSGNVSVQGTGLCGSGALSPLLPVTVNALPDAAGAITGDISVCQGQTKTYTVPVIPNATGYSWNLPAGVTITNGSNTRSITVSYPNSALSGNVTVVGTNGCGNGVSSTIAVTVNLLPIAAGSITGTASVCQGQTGVTYYVPAIDNATGYVWSLPTGATITAGDSTRSITVDFSPTALSGSISVYGTNACGRGANSVPLTVTLGIGVPPSAAGNITGSPTVCQGESGVSFSVDLITNASGYVWTLPYGAIIATGANTRTITVNFSSTALNGTVRVYGINGCSNGTVSPVYRVTVNPLPGTPADILGSLGVCQGQTTVPYSVSIANATRYVWNYSGTGATINGSIGNITIDFSATATSGNLSVYGKNDCGDGVVSSNHAITVDNPPGAAGIITGNTTVCQGQTVVSYTVPAIPYATDYIWTLPAGATITSGVNTSSILVSYSATASSGSVAVYGSNSCGNGTSSTSAITVNLLPGVAGSITGSTTVCEGATGVYSVLSIANATGYVWSLPSGAVITSGSNTSSITVSFPVGTISGNISVYGTNACGSGVASPSSAVSVDKLPIAPGVIVGNAAPCQNQTGVTYTVPAISNATSYIWSVPAGATITAGTTTRTITVSFSASAVSGNITVQGSSACGTGPVSANFPITVQSLPVAAGVITGTLTVCQGLNGVVYSVPAIAGATQYDWIVPSGTTIVSGQGTTSITVNFAATAMGGNIQVNGHNNCGDGISSTFAFSVDPLPVGAGTITGTTEVCQGRTAVTYTVPLIANASGYTWSLPVGATIASGTNTRSITVDYSLTAASGSITVQGTNTCGNGVVSPPLTITVQTEPSAAGSITGSSSVCQGQTNVNYTIPVISNATGYVWTLPSGASIASGNNTNSIFVNFSGSASSGTLSVYGTNACGSGTARNLSFVVASNPAAAGVISGPSAVCQGDNGKVYTVPVIANASGYTWNLPTGASIVSGDNTNSITVNFSASASPGNISVYGTNSCGNGASAIYPVTVNLLPAAAGTISGASSVCQGSTGIIYTVPSISNAITYHWTYPSGATIVSGGNTNTITVDFANDASPGVFTVYGENVCGNGAISANFNVTLNQMPDAAGTITGSNFVCQGATGVVYSVTPITNATGYSWSVPTGATITSGAGSNSIIVTYSNNAISGNVTVRGTSACGNGTVSANFPITVQLLPAAAGSITGTSSVCQGQNNVSYSVSAITGATSYVWTLPFGATIVSGWNTNSITVNYGSSATTGVVKVYGTNSCGSGVVSFDYLVTVNPFPAAAAAITGSALACQGSTGVVYSIPVIPTATSYNWTLPTGVSITAGSGTNSITVTYSLSAISGVISVYGYNNCGNGTQANLPVTVNTNPTLTSTLNPPAICSNSVFSYTSSGTPVGASFSWTRAVISGISNPGASGTGNINETLINTTTATVSVTYIYMVSANGCSGSTTYSVVVDVNPAPSLSSTLSPASICSDSQFAYTATSTTPGAIMTWTRASVTGIAQSAGSGTGNVSEYLSNTTAFPVNMTYIYTTTFNSCSSSQNVVVTVNPMPILSSSRTIPVLCSGSAFYYIATSTTTGATFAWSRATVSGITQAGTSGTGVINEILTNTTSAPIQVTYAFTVSANGCTNPITYTVVATVYPTPPTPVVTFSGATTFCVGGSVTLTAPAGYSYLWSNGKTTQSIDVNSTGNFSVVVADIVSGCSSVPSNTIAVTVIQKPYVEAGTTDFVCITGSYIVRDASITNPYSSFIWSIVTGAGTLLNPNSLTPTYIPVAADRGTQVSLKLTVDAMAPCTGTFSDNKLLTVNDNPIADAGPDTLICKTATYKITGASATNLSRLSWTTNGTGTFINPGSISPTYVPGIADFAMGRVILTLEAASPPCLSGFDQMELTFRSMPDVFAGYDATVDRGSSFQITTATVANYSTLLWSTSGTGTFNNINIINPVYTPSPQDFAWGSVRLTLTARGVTPCNVETISDYMILTVTGNPPVDFTWKISCPGWPVQFFIDNTVTNINKIVSYNWNFGDGTTSSLMEPTHTYGVPGLYNVTLTVVDTANYSNTVQKSVEVYELPVASFSYDAPGCKDEPTAFFDHSSGTAGYITKWQWNFGDGNSTTVIFPVNPNVTHTYSQSGTFTAILTVTSSTGCVATNVQTITIRPAPKAAFDNSGNCAENNVQFTDLSQTGGGSQIVTWLWNFGDQASGINNTSNLQNPAHIFNIAGTYTVTLTTTNVDNCSGTATNRISAGAGPPVEFMITSGTCIGSDVSFKADSTLMKPASIDSIYTYLWNFGDGGSSTLPKPTHVYNLAGTFQVTLSVVYNNGCTNSVSRPVTIGAPPVADFNYTSACFGIPTKFTDYSYTSSGEPIVSWLWKFNGTNDTTSTLPYPVFKYTAPGTYNVTLIVTSLSGCNDSITKPVQVLTAPKAKFKFIANTCADGNVSFQDLSTSTISAITGWKWEFEPGYISTLKNPNHIFSNTASLYNVKLTVTDIRGCYNTKEDTVRVPAGLEVDIDHSPACFGDSILFGPLAPAGDSLIAFQWDFGDVASGSHNTSNLRKPFHYFKTQGSYLVSLTATDTNNCSKTVYKKVDIQKLPAPVFSYTMGNCDSTVYFNASPTGGGVGIKSWIWKYGDGKSDTINVPRNGDTLHTYTSPGIYYVTMTVITRSGCSTSFSDSLLLKPCLEASFSTVDTLVCQNLAITFADSSSSSVPLTKWFWDFGDDSDSTYTTSRPAITHIFQTSGIFNVKLVISALIAGKTVTDFVTHQVKVNPSPIAGYITKDIAGDTTKGFCLGLPAIFVNASSGNGSQISSYTWDFGDPGTTLDSSSVKNPTYLYKNSGDFYATLVASNPFGCSDTITDSLTIYPLPKADFQFSNSCVGFLTRFTDISDTMNAPLIDWEWDFIDTLRLIGHSHLQNLDYLFATEGNFRAQLIITDNNLCRDTIWKRGVTHPVPISAFEIKEDYNNVQGQIYLINKTQGVVTGYEWDFDNGFTSTAKDPTIKYEYEGIYNIKLISSNSFQCTDTLTMPYSLMFKGLYVPNAFSPLPPNSPDIPELFNLFKPVGRNIETYIVEVYDSWGKLLWTSDVLDPTDGSPKDGWDGTYKGNLLPQDVYVWRISAVFKDGSVWNSKNAGDHTNIPEKTYGTVTLLR